MTEREAWLYLAEAWGNASAGGSRFYGVLLGWGWCQGLCLSITRLSTHGQISEEVRMSMHAKIRGEPRSFGYGYVWSLDGSGARSRVAYCREQARLLECPAGSGEKSEGA